MANEKDPATIKLNEKQVKDGIIRPYDSVVVRYLDSPFHKEGEEESIHPTLAAKLVKKEYAVIVDVENDTSGVAKVSTEAEIKSLTKKVKDKKSKGGVTVTAEEKKSTEETDPK